MSFRRGIKKIFLEYNVYYPVVPRFIILAEVGLVECLDQESFILICANYHRNLVVVPGYKQSEVRIICVNQS